MTQTVTDDKTHREREHFFGAAKPVALLTVLSRVAGMVRASAIAALGANALTDAFALAFTIPNLFRRLFAEGAMSAAFIPVFTDVHEKQGPEPMRRLLANTMALLSLFLLGLMILVQAGLMAWWAFWPGAADRQLCLVLTTIMMPFMVLVSMLALGAAAVNCLGRFAYPAATPIILNFIIVAAAWFVAPLWRGDVPAQLAVIAASVTVAGAIQFAGIVWLLRRTGFAVIFRLRPLEKDVGRVLRLMAPVLLGLGFLQVSELTERIIAWTLRWQPDSPTLEVFGLQLGKPLTAGVMQRLDAARYLYQFPLGVLAISLGVAVFPLLSRYASRGDTANLRHSVNRALRLAFMEGMATGVGLAVLAEPITRLLYRHGNFTESDVQSSARVLQMYAIGMWAYCTYQILVRAFYALKDTRTPLKIMCAMSVLEVGLVLALVFVPELKERAFGLAVAVTFSLNALALALALRKRLGLLGGRRFLLSAVRSCVAAAAMAGMILAAWRLMDGTPSWLVVLVCVPGGAAVFVGAAAAMRAPELGELFGSLLKRRAGDV